MSDRKPPGAVCAECEKIHAAHSEWVERYRDLRARRKLSLLAGKLPADLIEALAIAEAELKRLSELLTEHSLNHLSEVAGVTAA